MAFYGIRGFTGAIGATDDDAIGELWNPASARRVIALAAFCFRADSAGNTVRYYLTRTTARGTAGSTVTPGAVDADDNAVAPPSGALLDLGPFSVQPTLATPRLLLGGAMQLNNGSGFYLPFPRGLVLPAGAGLAICKVGSGADTANNCEVGFEFQD